MHPASRSRRGRTPAARCRPALALAGLLASAPAFADGLFDPDYFHEGDYVKTGPDTAVLQLYPYPAYVNAGSITVLQGALRVTGEAGTGWRHTGTILVDGGELEVSIFRGHLDFSGPVEVRRGAMTVRNVWSPLANTSAWTVGAGGRLRFEGSQGDVRDVPVRFAGPLRNDGLLQFDGAQVHLPPGLLSGRGELQVLRGADLRIDGALDTGALHLGAPYQPQGPSGPAPYFLVPRVEVAGPLSVDRLDWRGGELRAGGPVTVRGSTTLSGFSYLDAPNLPVKPMEGHYRFEGDVDWAGDHDLLGGARLQLAAGATFRDRTPQDLPGDAPDVVRPARLGVFEFDNVGTYLKTGVGRTQVEALFRNRGTVRAEDAAALVFQGPLDNTGTLEAVRSRIELRGPLAQWTPGSGTLGGGRWVMRDGVLAILPAGEAHWPRLRLERNAGTIVLDGPRARMESVSMSNEVVNPLDALNDNRGRLEVLGGASLRNDLTNHGTVVVGAGSALGSQQYRQSGADSATWVAGTLRGRALLEEGRFGAGLEGEVGHAELGAALFGDGLLLLADIASAARFDTLHTGGSLGLDGELHAEFAPGAAGPGRWRLLSSDASLSGRFDRLTSNLDPALYRLGALYGADFMELTVSPVPEPGTWALTALGLAGLAGWRRRRPAA